MFGLNTTPQGGAYTTKIGLGDIDGTLTPDNLGIRVADRQVAQFNPAAITGAIGDMGQAQRLLALQQVEESDAMAKNTRLRILGSLAPQAIQAATGISMQSAQQSRNRVQQLVDQFLPQVAQQRREAFKAAQLAPLQAAMEAAKVAGDAQRSNMQNQAQVYNQMATTSETIQGQKLARDAQAKAHAVQMVKANPFGDMNTFVEMGLSPEFVTAMREEHTRKVDLEERRTRATETSAANSGGMRVDRTVGNARGAAMAFGNGFATANTALAGYLARGTNANKVPLFKGMSPGQIEVALNDPQYFKARQQAVRAMRNASPANLAAFERGEKAANDARRQMLQAMGTMSLSELAMNMQVPEEELASIIDPEYHDKQGRQQAATPAWAPAGGLNLQGYTPPSTSNTTVQRTPSGKRVRP